jgi:thiol-disulfide isomerase/thioredoxin
MKRNLLTIGFIIITLGAFTQENVKLSGKIINPTGDKVYLYKPTVVDNKYTPKYHDSTTLNEDGTFELSASVNETDEAVFYDGNEQFSMLLSPDDNMHLTLNTAYFDETIQFSGEGSDKNNALKNLYLIDEANSKELQSRMLEDEIDTVALFDLQAENNDAYLAIIGDYEKEIPEIEKRTVVLAQSAERSSQSLKMYLRSKIVFENKMKPLLNKTAIDFSGVNLNGEKVSLSDFKGKITVVDFWATWCGPCKAEFPAYKELEEKYGDEVNFVSVGVYCKEDDWKKMATEEGFKQNIFISKEEQDQISKYEVKTIPRYLVLDENFNLIDADAPRPSSGKLQSYWK